MEDNGHWCMKGFNLIHAPLLELVRLKGGIYKEREKKRERERKNDVRRKKRTMRLQTQWRISLDYVRLLMQVLLGTC